MSRSATQLERPRWSQMKARVTRIPPAEQLFAKEGNVVPYRRSELALLDLLELNRATISRPTPERGFSALLTQEWYQTHAVYAHEFLSPSVAWQFTEPWQIIDYDPMAFGGTIHYTSIPMPEIIVSSIPIENASFWPITISHSPISAPTIIETRFNELVSMWQYETGGQSSLSRITGNRHYLRIIAELGEGAIPLILGRLQSTPEPWFVALRAITGDYQVGSQYSGNFRKMADAWIEWGKQNNYM